MYWALAEFFLIAPVAFLLCIFSQGRGETTPTAFFYQNLGEAEYVVATYQYMRLLGYPASKISILTAYNGQCQLIQDVVQQRCANNDIFGEPGRIATVDK